MRPVSSDTAGLPSRSQAFGDRAGWQLSPCTLTSTRLAAYPYLDEAAGLGLAASSASSSPSDIFRRRLCVAYMQITPN